MSRGCYESKHDLTFYLHLRGFWGLCPRSPLVHHLRPWSTATEIGERDSKHCTDKTNVARHALYAAGVEERKEQKTEERKSEAEGNAVGKTGCWSAEGGK